MVANTCFVLLTKVFSDPPCTPDRQETYYRRDWCWSAWCSNCNCLCSFWYGMCHLYGCRGCPKTSPQRFPHSNAWRQSYSCAFGFMYAQGRCQRGHEGLGHQSLNNPLPRLKPQPHFLTMIIAARRRARAFRTEKAERAVEWRQDLKHELNFERTLTGNLLEPQAFDPVFKDQGWGQCARSHSDNTILIISR